MSRTFIITGASKGIGLALAQRLAGQGHHIVGLARHPAADFPGTLVPVDLSDQAATSDVLADLTSRFVFDGAVNNVGLVRPQKLGAVELSALDEVLLVNLRPAVQMVQSLLQGLQAQGWGRIVNISSLTVLGSVERTAYAAAKAALVSFTCSCALELAQTGITVNAVAPGPTETELFRANNPSGSAVEQMTTWQILFRKAHSMSGAEDKSKSFIQTGQHGWPATEGSVPFSRPSLIQLKRRAPQQASGEQSSTSS